MSVDINSKRVRRVTWRARTSQEESDSEWSDDDIYENTKDFRESMPAPTIRREPVYDCRLPVTAGAAVAVQNKEEPEKPLKSNSARKKDRIWSSGGVNATKPLKNTNRLIGSMDPLHARPSQGEITTASSTTAPQNIRQIVNKSAFDDLKNLVEELQDQLESSKQHMARLVRERDSEISQINSQTSRIRKDLQDQLEVVKQNLTRLARQRDSEIPQMKSQTSRIQNKLQEQVEASQQRDSEISQIKSQISGIDSRISTTNSGLETKLRNVVKAFADCIPVRLVGGSSASQGRVEIFHQGTWGTICDDSWDMNDAKVVCRMLGYATATGAPTEAANGQGSGNIWLDEVACTGDELHITLCSHQAWGTHDCSHVEDASAICA